MENPPAYVAAGHGPGPEQRFQEAQQNLERLHSQHSELSRECVAIEAEIRQLSDTVKRLERDIEILNNRNRELRSTDVERSYESFAQSNIVVEQNKTLVDALTTELNEVVQRLNNIKPHLSKYKQIKNMIDRAQAALSRQVELDLELDARIEMTQQKLDKLQEGLYAFYASIPDVTPQLTQDLENKAALEAILLDVCYRKDQAEIDLANSIDVNKRRCHAWTHMVQNIIVGDCPNDVRLVTKEQLRESVRQRIAHNTEQLEIKNAEVSAVREVVATERRRLYGIKDQISAIVRDIDLAAAEVQLSKQQLDDFRRISSVVSALPPHYELDELRATVREQGLQIAQLTRTVEELVARLNSQ